MADIQYRDGAADRMGGLTAEALLRLTRMNEAEAYNLNLFVAPERLFRARRTLAAGLFQRQELAAPHASNDNRG